MNLAIEHLQKQVRVLEAQISTQESALSQEQKQVAARTYDIEILKSTLGELRSAVAVLSRSVIGTVVVEGQQVHDPRPETKKKRA